MRNKITCWVVHTKRPKTGEVSEEPMWFWLAGSREELVAKLGKAGLSYDRTGELRPIEVHDVRADDIRLFNSKSGYRDRPWVKVVSLMKAGGLGERFWRITMASDRDFIPVDCVTDPQFPEAYLMLFSDLVEESEEKI